MKKLLILLDTDDWREIQKFQDHFLKTELTFIPKGVEIWEVDEENNMVRKI